MTKKEKKSVSKKDRAVIFYEKWKERGFDNEDIFFIARQYKMFERDNVKCTPFGRVLLNDVVHTKGLERVLESLEKVKDIESLIAYCEDIYINYSPLNWAHSFDDTPGFTDKVRSIIDLLAHTDVQIALDKICKQAQILREKLSNKSYGNKSSEGFESETIDQIRDLMARHDWPGSDKMMDLASSMSMAEIGRECGLHSISYSKFLYPGKEGAIRVGAHLLAINEGLKLVTGLDGPVFGLGGMIKINIGDGTLKSAGGRLQSANKISSKPVGDNFSGCMIITTADNGVWSSIVHEWAHSFDLAIPLISGEGVTKSVFSSQDNDSATAKVIDKLSRYKNIKDSTSYLKEILPDIESTLNNMLEGRYCDLDSYGVIDRYKKIIEIAKSGKEVDNIAKLWIENDKDKDSDSSYDYWNDPTERFAYGFESAVANLEILPKTTELLCYGDRSYQKMASDEYKNMFGSEEVQMAWRSIKSKEKKTSLHSHISKRRDSKKEELGECMGLNRKKKL